MELPNAPVATSNGAPNGLTQQAPPAGQPAAPAAQGAAAPHEPSIEERLAEAERKGSEKAAQEWKGRYAGLQRTHEQVRAELARAQQNSQLLSGIPALKEAVQLLLSKNATPEELAALNTKIELETLKQQSSGFGQPQAQMPAEAPPTEEVDRRAEILRYWAPDTQLSHDDARLDWAQDAPNKAEAQRRFMASIRKAEREDAAKQAGETARKQAQDTLVRAGLETTDGTPPSGPITNPLLPQNPAEWKRPGHYLQKGYEQLDSMAARKAQAREVRRETNQQEAARNAAAAGTR